MPEGTWTCSNCGQIYSLAETSCGICHITRDNRHVIGKITTVRTPKAAPEKVEVAFPFFIKEARFNLPLASGAVWLSGTVMFIEAGVFLLCDRDPVQASELAARPPAASGPVGSMSAFIQRGQLSRIVHQKLIGEFIEIQGRQKVPLRLSREGWTDLDVICDQMGIPRA